MKPMAGTVRPMLPPLGEAHRVPPLPKAGIWHAMGSADPLQLIARGLNTGARLTETAGDIVSVPDVWAQVTVFGNALGSEGHPLHRRAVAEWRGLLGCFALAAYRVPELSAELVPLRAGTSGWSQLAGRLTPQCSLLDGGRFAEVALVRAGRTLIALAQPLTLLAPSRSLPDLVAARPPVPWMADGRFQDPLVTADLSREERAVLLRFLDTLCADLEVERDAGRDVQTLLGLARSYRDQAGQGAGMPPGTQFDLEPVSLALPALKVFRALRTRERAGVRSGAALSDCVLALRPDIAASSQLKGIILFDPTLHEQLGRPAGEIVVWGRHSLRMLQDRPDSLDALRAEAQSAGYLVINASDLFLPKLYRTDGVDGEAAFEQHPPGARGHLLPLSPLLLAALRRTEIAQACRMSSRGAAGNTVDLRLSLADGSSVTLSRTYAGEEGGEPPLTLSTWPNFRADWWRLHLAYSGTNPEILYVASGFVSAQGLAKALSAGSDGYSAVAAARTLLGGDVSALAETTWFRQTRGSATALHALPGAAEAVVLQDQRSGTRQVAGLLLLPEPAQVAAGSGGTSARIGIDFGTTNTAVYVQADSGEPQALRILPRHILAYRPTRQGQEELDAELLPVEPVDIPFQTILRDRRLPPQRDERRAFRDTLIYFAQDRAAALRRLDNTGGDDDLFANLKWGDDLPSRERVELFLVEVCVLALAEVAALGIQPANVRFAYSFPEAFRPDQHRSFVGAARNACARALLMVGGKAGAVPVEPKFQTESVATAQYFINRLNTPVTEGVVTFDIGGQTTDVAVVQSQGLGTESLAWRGSFQLAGRHLLIDFLRENPSIIAQLARGSVELQELQNVLATVGKSSVEKRTTGTELLVNSRAFMEGFDTVLPTLGGMREADRLRATALTGLAGLFTYVGRTVRHLAETKRITARVGTPISICLGGRASLLYRTLLRTEDERDAALKFFTDAAGDAMPLARLVFSQEPKQEVAFGLVADDGALTGRVASEPLLGEALRFGTVDAPASALMSSLDIDYAWRIEEPAEFRRFLQKLPELRIRPTLPPAALGQLTGLANAEMAKALRTAQQERSPGETTADTSRLEPPFIVLLRLFVHRLAVEPEAVRS